jgi:hypothetical protein
MGPSLRIKTEDPEIIEALILLLEQFAEDSHYNLDSNYSAIKKNGSRTVHLYYKKNEDI